MTTLYICNHARPECGDCIHAKPHLREYASWGDKPSWCTEWSSCGWIVDKHGNDIKSRCVKVQKS
jgi:hypothetical protein